MSQLRNTIKAQFVEKLDNSAFTANDFEIYFGLNEKEDHLVRITFNYDEQYTFTLNGVGVGGSFQMAYRPGETFEEDVLVLQKPQEALKYIDNWTRSVRSDLKASSFLVREIDKVAQLLEEQLTLGEPDKEYTFEEVELLKTKIDELEKKFEDFQRKDAISEEKLKTILDSLDQIKEDVTVYPKSVWVKTATNKIYSIVQGISKTKEGKVLLVSGAKKLLNL